MTTETLTLTDFLLARIAEDEAVARAAQDDTGPGRWNAQQIDYEGSYIYADRDGEGGAVSIESSEGDRLRHAIRHDPARVLAECEAKRRLILGESAITFSERQGRGPSDLHNYVMRALASVYRDHPDYRAEWA